MSYERPIRAGIIAQSKRLPAIVATGGLKLFEPGGVHALQECFDPRSLAPSKDCATSDVRLDIENVGHNLKS